MKKILLIVAYSLIVLYVAAQSTLPERYVPYIVDVVYTSNYPVQASGKGKAFIYRMKADTVPQLLVVQYSGENKPGKGENFLFNISVNDTLLYTEGLNRNRHGLFEVVYPIPAEALKNGTSALVRFEAYDQSASIGEIYAVAIVRQKLKTGLFADKQNWQGVTNDWTCTSDGTFIYTEPDGPRHPYTDNSVIDLMSYYGLELNLKLSGTDDIPVEILVSSNALKLGKPEKKDNPFDTRKVRLTLQKQKNGDGRLFVPFSVFDTPKASQSTIRRIKSIAVRLAGKHGGKVKLLSTRLVEGNSVKVTADSYSKSGEAGETVIYPVWITNCESKSQTVSFSIPKYGWEAFPVTVEPAQIELAPVRNGKWNYRWWYRRVFPPEAVKNRYYRFCLLPILLLCRHQRLPLCVVCRIRLQSIRRKDGKKFAQKRKNMTGLWRAKNVMCRMQTLGSALASSLCC